MLSNRAVPDLFSWTRLEKSGTSMTLKTSFPVVGHGPSKPWTRASRPDGTLQDRCLQAMSQMSLERTGARKTLEILLRRLDDGLASKTLTSATSLTEVI